MKKLLSVGLLCLLILFLVPILWALFLSFAPDSALFSLSSDVFSRLSFDNYINVFRYSEMIIPICNSLLIAGVTTTIVICIGSLCAYAFVRFRFPGKNILLGFILLASMFPQISLVGPIFLILRSLGLINTYPGLILPYTSMTLPITIWMLRSFFLQLPWEVEDAASIDGASRIRTLVSIIIPMAAPGLVSIAIIVFVFCWNEFLFALTFSADDSMYTIPVALTMLRGQYQVPWGQILAASIATTLPLLAVVLLFQKHIVSGLTFGAVKG